MNEAVLDKLKYWYEEFMKRLSITDRTLYSGKIYGGGKNGKKMDAESRKEKGVFY